MTIVTAITLLLTLANAELIGQNCIVKSPLVHATSGTTFTDET